MFGERSSAVLTAAQQLTSVQLESSLAVAVVEAELCEYCGNETLAWRKCKQLCTHCGNINRSCADL